MTAAHRRVTDSNPEVMALRLAHIEETLQRLDGHMSAINAALIGTVDQPGFVAQIASHEESIDAHKRNFRLIAGTFIAQIITLLGWSLTQLYANLTMHP